MASNVRIIPATIRQKSANGTHLNAKRRTAAYARVSTDSEEQLTSYEAQVDYYTKYIKERADWEFVRVYTDEGISATNTKKRDGFKQMIADALDGKIDLIITKSVSRFARNTVDSLVTVRQLKEKGVEVYFEKENIYTLDSKGELLITIMSSLAQEESRSISENVTWGQRKRMADGKVSLPYGQFLGYEKGEGLHKEYWIRHSRRNADEVKTEIIVLVSDSGAMERLESFASKQFNDLYDMFQAAFRKLREERKDTYKKLALSSTTPIA